MIKVLNIDTNSKDATTGFAFINEPTRNSLVFEAPYEAIKAGTISNLDLYTRKVYSNKLSGGDGIITIKTGFTRAAGFCITMLVEANNKIYNITRSDTKLTTLHEAAEIAIAIAGRGSIEVLDRDLSFPKRGRLNIDRAVNDFGYNPQVDVDEGFKRYYEWFRNSIYWSPKTVSKP